MDGDQETIDQAEGLRKESFDYSYEHSRHICGVITRGERRRRWSIEEKREIVAEGLIEIVLPGGASARVDAQVDGRALRRVLGALREP